MTVVSDFGWIIGSPEITWTADGRPVLKRYEAQVVSAVVLKDGTGVAVVEPELRVDGRNAVVFNADGSERYRLERPCRAYESCHFAQIYYVRDEITAFLVIRGTDFAYVFDPQTGAYVRHYETR